MLPAAALAGAALLLHAESAVAFSGFPTRPPGFPPTRPRPSRPPGFGDFPTAPDDAPPNDGFQTGPTTTIGSESSCEAISKTTNFKESIDAHVSAVALAWNEACSKEVTPTWLRDIHDQFLATSQTSGGAEAFAFAKAVATVEVACTSEGNAYGCAAAYAFAQSWAQAAAMAHAEAWAQAVQQCECGGKDQITAAEADAFASETFKLTAEVEALAQASVCAGFGSSASDGDAQTCIQDIYAWVYAKAIATAVIDGFCIPPEFYKDKDFGEYTAEAYAQATASIEVDEIKGCEAYASDYTP